MHHRQNLYYLKKITKKSKINKNYQKKHKILQFFMQFFIFLIFFIFSKDFYANKNKLFLFQKFFFSVKSNGNKYFC